jgi:hypothetical protein
MVKQKQDDFIRPDPLDSQHFKDSPHSGVSPNRETVRIRHPEAGDKEVKETQGDGIFGWAGGGDSSTLNVDDECLPTADTRCYPLDLFERVKAPPTYTTGAVMGGGSHRKGISGSSTSFYLRTMPSPLGKYNIESYVGGAATAYTSGDNPCDGLAFQFTGWGEESSHYVYTVGEHPANAAGLLTGEFQFGSGVGRFGGTVARDNGIDVYVSDHEPTHHRDGVLIGHLPGEYAIEQFFIPISLVPDEGEEMWLSLAPGWQAEFGGYTCSMAWPWMTGELNSGKTGFTNTHDSTLTWQIVNTGDADWGRALSSDATDAWWEGNLPWDVSTSGGTYGIDGNNLYFTVAAGGQETMIARMNGASAYDPGDSYDEALGEPWTLETGVEMKVRFRLTTAGNITETGTRYAQFQWHDGRQVNTATVWLGDKEQNQGLTLYDEASSDNVDKDITEGSWMWLALDARNPDYARATMWKEGAAWGSGRPPIYDVQVATALTAEAPTSENYFEMMFSLGNMTGAAQTIEIASIYFCGSGEDCEWVEYRIGQGDGYQTQYVTPQKFKPNSLWFFVDGHHVRAKALDYNTGRFTSYDGLPADDKSILVVRHLVDEAPEE